MSFHLIKTIRINIFYIDNIIKKVVCAAFYSYIFEFITHFYIDLLI